MTGKQLKTWIMKNGMSQGGFADLMKVSRMTITYWVHDHPMRYDNANVFSHFKVAIEHLGLEEASKLLQADRDDWAKAPYAPPPAEVIQAIDPAMEQRISKLESIVSGWGS
mgnify:FL=1